MSAVGIGLTWAFITVAAFAALSTSGLARTRHELEVDPRGPHLTNLTSSAETAEQWPAIEVVPTSAVLRSSPSVARMQSNAGGHDAILLS
jgi:hypothetical protein